MKRTGISIVFPALLLAFAICFCACGEKTVGPKAEYDLPRKVTVQDGYGGYTSYKLTYEGNALRIGYIDGGSRLLRCDSDGRLIEETSYTPNGKEKSTTTYAYDKNGNLTEERRGGTLREVRTYDERGNLLSWQSYTLDTRGECTYDENGNELTQISYDADGKIKSRSESVYDEQGNRTVWVYYDGNGKESARNECTYDENGRERTWIRYDGGTFSFCLEYVYDENGNQIQTLAYEEDGTYRISETNAYDGHGNVIENIVYDPDGVPGVRYAYTYDERGNQTEEAIFDPPDTFVERYSYTYDDYGYQTGFIIHYADGREKVDWQVEETVTALASEVQAAFYRSCIDQYVLPIIVR